MTQRATLRVVINPNVHFQSDLLGVLNLAGEPRKVHWQTNSVHPHPLVDAFNVVIRLPACRDANATMPQRLGGLDELEPQLRVSRQRVIEIYRNQHCIHS
jgi:hypothetical protein